MAGILDKLFFYAKLFFYVFFERSINLQKLKGARPISSNLDPTSLGQYRICYMDGKSALLYRNKSIISLRDTVGNPEWVR